MPNHIPKGETMVQNCCTYPSSNDIFRIIVVNIDNQNDFVREDGRLSVLGAVAAAQRASSFIDTNREKITTILSSYDKHRELHIFYGTWWMDDRGNHPPNFTNITHEDVQKHVWVPRFDIEWSENYVKTLGSFTIWPVHCTEGTFGSCMISSVCASIAIHSLIRKTQPLHLEKGQNARTEHYGIFSAEVVDPDDYHTKLNQYRLRQISAYDLSYWFGQEKNHCVRRSLEQYISWCENNNPEAISRMRYVEDCISLLPLGETYEIDARDSVRSMVKKGMVVVKSTDPII
jgi:nicotinamidase/pyrazinamidase